MKPVFLAIGAGMISGLLVVASMSGASIAVAYLTLVLPMPLFMVGLGLGTRASILAAISGVVTTMLAGPVAAAVFMVMFAAPAWIITRMALAGPNGVVTKRPPQDGPFHQEGPETESTFAERITGRGVKDWLGETGEAPRDLGWMPAGWIVAAMAVFAGALIIIAAFMTGGLQSAVETYLAALADAISTPEARETLGEAIRRAVPFFPGSVASFWAVTMLGNAILAQGLLAKGGRNLRPTPRLRELALPDWLSWALVAVAAMALLGPGEVEYVGQNLVLVLAVPFFFLGLSVVHKMAAMTPLPGALLALVYMVVIFSGWFALFIAGVGILEQWVGLAKHFGPPATKS